LPAPVYYNEGAGVAGSLAGFELKTILLQPNVPSQPVNLKGWPTSSESIALTWEEPTVMNGRISSYLVTYAEVGAKSLMNPSPR
jgi:hypothetical protein